MYSSFLRLPKQTQRELLCRTQVDLVAKQLGQRVDDAPPVAVSVVHVLLVPVRREPDDGVRGRRLRDPPRQLNLLGREEVGDDQHAIALELIDVRGGRREAGPARHLRRRDDGTPSLLGAERHAECRCAAAAHYDTSATP